MTLALLLWATLTAATMLTHCIVAATALTILHTWDTIDHHLNLTPWFFGTEKSNQ